MKNDLFIFFEKVPFESLFMIWYDFFTLVADMSFTASSFY